MLRPQRRADDAGRDGVDAHARLRVQRRQAAHEAGDGELAGAVEGRVEVGHLPGHRADVDDALGVEGRRPRGRGPVAARRRVQPQRERQLRRADRVRDVDVEQLVVPPVRVVAGLGRGARRVPEVGPVRLVDAGAGAEDVEVAEGGERGREQVAQRRPRRHVRLVEGGARRLGGVVVLADEVLGLGPQGDVGEDDVAVAGEEEAGEGEVDACVVEVSR